MWSYATTPSVPPQTTQPNDQYEGSRQKILVLLSSSSLSSFRWYVEQRHVEPAWSHSLWKKLQRIFSSKRAGEWLRFMSLPLTSTLGFSSMSHKTSWMSGYLSSSSSSSSSSSAWSLLNPGGRRGLQCGQVPQSPSPWQCQHHSSKFQVSVSVCVILAPKSSTQWNVHQKVRRATWLIAGWE